MLVSVGSHSNVDDPDTTPAEFHRADVLEFTPEGKFEKVYASGIRNCVGEAIQPDTGELWCSVNERDGLGNNLVPDYITHVQEGGFYGWPWYSWEAIRTRVTWASVPSCNPRSLPRTSRSIRTWLRLKFNFMKGHSSRPNIRLGFRRRARFLEPGPARRLRGDHRPRGGGKATGEYEDFLTGFVTPDGKVWGRPVGIVVAKDGSLLVSDDGSNSIWRVTYTGDKTAAGGPVRPFA